MTSDVQFRMLNAVYACLLPIARLLLRSGINYRQFDAVAKRAFVREAIGENDSRGRSVNTSRVAVKTGLSRKDVKRIRDSLSNSSHESMGAIADQSGPLARVLHAWHVDQRFIDENGNPRDLDFQNDDDGFSALVRAVAGDVPPGAVRVELKRAGAIVELECGRFRLVKRYYVPGSFDEKAITVMSGMLFPLAMGIAHNANPDRASEGFIQRFAYSDGLNSTLVPEFRRWSRMEATKFIEAMDDWLARNESPAQGGDRHADGVTTGIGVFYYEGPNAERMMLSTSPVARPSKSEE